MTCPASVLVSKLVSLWCHRSVLNPMSGCGTAFPMKTYHLQITLDCGYRNLHHAAQLFAGHKCISFNQPPQLHLTFSELIISMVSGDVQRVICSIVSANDYPAPSNRHNQFLFLKLLDYISRDSIRLTLVNPIQAHQLKYGHASSSPLNSCCERTSRANLGYRIFEKNVRQT